MNFKINLAQKTVCNKISCGYLQDSFFNCNQDKYRYNYKLNRKVDTKILNAVHLSNIILFSHELFRSYPTFTCRKHKLSYHRDKCNNLFKQPGTSISTKRWQKRCCQHIQDGIIFLGNSIRSRCEVIIREDISCLSRKPLFLSELQ